MANLAFFITNTDVRNLISACNLLKCNSVFKHIKRLLHGSCWRMCTCVYTYMWCSVSVCTYVYIHMYTYTPKHLHHHLSSE